MDETELTPDWSKLDDKFNELKELSVLIELFPKMFNPLPSKESSLDEKIELSDESLAVL